MSVLRVYDPAECDDAGVPLDWLKCRACEGTGERPGGPVEVPVRPGGIVARMTLSYCEACGGHGSLRAAALAERVERQANAEFVRRMEPLERDNLPADQRAALDQIERHAVRIEEVAASARATVVVRCEDCGHPMSDGCWEGDPEPAGWTHVQLAIIARSRLAHGAAVDLSPVHYSHCDEGCRHTDFRCRADWVGPWTEASLDPDELRTFLEQGVDVDASWRIVDVRSLGWPHDLRPEKLGVLCLRCYAARTVGT